MLITGVLSLAAAVLLLTLGVRALRQRPVAATPDLLVRRAIAPAQVTAGGLLAVAGATTAAGSPRFTLLTVVLCVAGALVTLAAGAWQGAKYAARISATAGSPAPKLDVISTGGCAGGCCGGGGCS